MPSQNITLYVDAPFTSPYALSVFVALTEKGLPFELKTVDLQAQEQRKPEFKSHSLTARVPALTHGDFWLSESSAITEYLDEAFPSPDYPALYPKDMVARARARQIQGWLRTDLADIRNERPTTVIFGEPNPAPLSDKACRSVEKLLLAAQALLPDAAENLFGDWCIADTELALMLNRLVFNGDEVPERLAVYAKRQWQRPSVQAWLLRRKK